MAQYIAKAKGNRGEVSCCGTKASGITAQVNGWDIGCDVQIQYDELKETDILAIRLNDGSNSFTSSDIVYRFYKDKNGGLVQI